MIIRRALLLCSLSLTLASGLYGQSSPPPGEPPRPEAVYTPRPVYRAEWAKQNLSGKGVVLVTIDTKTGNVSGARMLESTGNQMLDGAALAAYSKWRFKPGGSVTQVKMPIEFKPGPAGKVPPPGGRTPPNTYFLLLIVIGVGAVLLAMRKRRSL